MKRVVVAVGCFLIVCSVGVGALAAQEIGFNGIGGRLSFVDPEGPIGSTVGLGVHADLGEIIKQLRLYPSLEYWSKSSFSQFVINGDLRYYFPTQGKADFFAGGGLAILFNSVGDFNASAVGLNFLGGADFPVNEQLLGTVTVKFLASDINALKITAGITYLLNR